MTVSDDHTDDDWGTGDDLPPLPSERLIIDFLIRSDADQTKLKIARGLSTAIVLSPGRAQSAVTLREDLGITEVTAWYVDSHRAAVAADRLNRADVRVVCQPDLPDQPLDVAVLPVLKNGEAEMNRDLLQQSHDRLKPGGVLIAAVNSATDTWLIGQMQQVFEKVNCHSTPEGRVYFARKTTAAVKPRSFVAEITFRVDDRVLTTVSRPSVFSHRSVDQAARVMIREVAIEHGCDVLELGCGNGAVALAAALRSPGGRVVAVDCNARAVQCVQQAAAINGITNLRAVLNHDGDLSGVGVFDVALLNPPYYGDFGIARHFMRTATAVLRPGGTLWVITKNADAYLNTAWTGLRFHDETRSQGYDLLAYKRTRHLDADAAGLVPPPR